MKKPEITKEYVKSIATLSVPEIEELKKNELKDLTEEELELIKSFMAELIQEEIDNEGNEKKYF